MSRWASFVVLVLVFLSAVPACRSNVVPSGIDQSSKRGEPQRRPDTEKVHVNWSDPVPPHDAYFTWKDVEYGPSQALYYWLDEPVGRGEQGFRQILTRLERLPRGSRVLVYPLWWHCWTLHGVVEACIPPWALSGDELFTLAARRDLVIVESPKDPMGRLCPECRGEGYARSSEADRQRFPLEDSLYHAP